MSFINLGSWIIVFRYLSIDYYFPCKFFHKSLLIDNSFCSYSWECYAKKSFSRMKEAAWSKRWVHLCLNIFMTKLYQCFQSFRAIRMTDWDELVAQNLLNTFSFALQSSFKIAIKYFPYIFFRHLMFITKALLLLCCLLLPKFIKNILHKFLWHELEWKT